MYVLHQSFLDGCMRSFFFSSLSLTVAIVVGKRGCYFYIQQNHDR